MKPFSRGFVSILLVLAIAAVLLLSASLFLSTRASSQELNSISLPLERKYNAELDVKHAMLEAMKKGAQEAELTFVLGGFETREIRDGAAERLAELEQFVEENYSRESGLEINIWCGSPSYEELNNLPEEMQRANKTLKCASCFDFSETEEECEISADDVEAFLAGGVPPCLTETKTVRKCSRFLYAETYHSKLKLAGFIVAQPASLTSVYVRASLDGLSTVDTLISTNESIFGISILDKQNGIASVALIPSGTGVDY
ncbi:MAG: hypothetical protein ABIH99_06025 [Candidatus Micrarchaeota archaeon]